MYPYSNPKDRSLNGFYPSDVPVSMSHAEMGYEQPSGLLMGTPYMYQMPVNHNGSKSRSSSSGSYSRKYSGDRGFPSSSNLHYYSPTTGQSKFDQLNLSRTVMLKNINEKITLHEVLDNISFGSIEYCKLFIRPSPPHIKDVSQVKSCLITFVSSRDSVAFHVHYSRNPKDMSELKDKLSSKYLQISLNDSWGTSRYNAVMPNHLSGPDFVKSRTLNYINEMGATRCFTGNFLLDKPEEIDVEQIENDLKLACAKFGQIEDFNIEINKEQKSGTVFVHFTSIDSAIKSFEHFDHIITDEITNADFSSSISFASVGFHRDRCDRTRIGLTSSINSNETTLQNYPPVATSVGSASTESVDDDKLEFDRNNGTFENNSKDFSKEKILKEGENNSDESQFSEYPYIESLNNSFVSSMSFDLNSSPSLRHQGAVRLPYHSSTSNIPFKSSGFSYQYNPDPFNIGNRTIYLGNLHSDITVTDIANNIRAGGLVESIKFHPQKRICFVTFIDPTVAFKFYLNHQVLHSLIIHGYEVSVGWAKHHSGPLSRDIALSVTAGASRNVYIGIKANKEEDEPVVENQKPLPSLEQLRIDFSNFGALEQINYFHDKACVFLNFLNISSAIRLVRAFSDDNVEKINKICEDQGEVYDRYKDYKINFGKDRCGNPPKFVIKKKHGKRNASKSHNMEESEFQEKDETKQNTSISDEAAMVFGIISKDNEYSSKGDLEGSSDIFKESTDNTNEILPSDSTVNSMDSASDLHGSHVIFDGEHSNSSGLNIVLDSSEVTGKAEIAEKGANNNSDTEDEFDDYDDISIIIGSDDAPVYSPKRGAKKSDMYTFKSKSADAFSSSYHKRSLYGYDHQAAYDPYKFTPLHGGYSFLNQQGHGVFPNQYFNQSYSRPNYPSVRGNYASSGSEVMAQYLARVQHDDIMYTSGAFNGDQNVDMREPLMKHEKSLLRK